ncbi:hypothetical protein ABMA27_016796 [Loxostege sticticalis]|uniref:BED-type domain-containing protein n=1 Tax=Loxostege sticticalis TaxID=481309 RepID=A0ABR3I3L2_LOXSC
MAPTKKSVVWDFFNKNQEKATCNMCKAEYKNVNTTTNLINHLKRKHPVQYQEKLNISESEPEPSTSTKSDAVPKKKQTTLLPVTSKTKLSGAEKRKLDKALLNLIIWDYQPLSIVEQKGFVEYSKALNANYELPSRKTLSANMLEEHYKLCRAAAQEMLNGIDYIACTTDLWSSDSNRSYVTLTAHFIANGRLQCITISTKEADFAHSALGISLSLRESFDEWKIFDKIVAIVTDNAPNVKKAVNEHLNKRNQYCVAHTLNLAIGDCVKDDGGADDESEDAPKLQDLISKCRAIVSHFKHSDKSSYKLREIQKQMELPELKVIQDIVTRWNSQYYMMSRLLELKVPLSAAIVAISNPPNNLTNDEWIAVEDIVKLLKPAEQATAVVSGEKYPTLSSTIPLIKSLKDSIRRKNPVSEAGKKLQRRLLSVLDKRLGVLDSNKTACKSTLLDPRFKKEGFCSNVVAERAYQWCLSELTNTVAESRSRSESEGVIANESLQGTSADITESMDVVTVGTNNDDDLWSSFDERIQNVTESAPITNAAISLKQYVEGDYLDRKSNPLIYWENRKHTYPDLYKMAMKYLCIPATSVPAERVFSKAGLLCNQRRNRLDPEKVDQILFLDSFTNNK